MSLRKISFMEDLPTRNAELLMIGKFQFLMQYYPNLPFWDVFLYRQK